VVMMPTASTPGTTGASLGSTREQVGEVDADHRCLHDNLARLRLRLGQVGRGEHLGPFRLGNLDRAYVPSSLRWAVFSRWLRSVRPQQVAGAAGCVRAELPDGGG
jgi:hypothetical protein